MLCPLIVLFPVNDHKPEFVVERVSGKHTKGIWSEFVHGKKGKNLKLVSYRCKLVQCVKKVLIVNHME